MTRRYSFAQRLYDEFCCMKDDANCSLVSIAEKCYSENKALRKSYLLSLAESISSYVVGSFNKEECEEDDERKLETAALLERIISDGFNDGDGMPEYNFRATFGVYSFYAGDEEIIKETLIEAAELIEEEEWRQPSKELMRQYMLAAREITKELVQLVVASVRLDVSLRRNTQHNSGGSFSKRVLSERSKRRREPF